MVGIPNEFERIGKKVKHLVNTLLDPSPGSDSCKIPEVSYNSHNHRNPTTHQANEDTQNRTKRRIAALTGFV